MEGEEMEAVDAVEAEQIAYAAVTTEEPELSESGDGELEVSVRLIDEGALVRWTRAPGDAARCTVRWYEGAPPGERLLATGHTLHDYMLVSGAEEGVRYWARVQCAGAWGGAALRVPEYARLRGVALGCAAAALLLAALGVALYAARRRVCAREGRADKRLR